MKPPKMLAGDTPVKHFADVSAKFGKAIDMKPKRTSKSAMAMVQPNPETLTTDLRELILSAHQTVARGVNSALVLLY